MPNLANQINNLEEITMVIVARVTVRHTLSGLLAMP